MLLSAAVKHRSAFSLALALCTLAACSAGQSPAYRDLPRLSARPKRPAATARPLLQAHRFAEVTNVIGPYVASDSGRALAVWAEPRTETGRKLLALPIAADGTPGKTVEIGVTTGELDLLSVRSLALGSDSARGSARFALVFTRNFGDKTRIEAHALAADGRPLGAAVQLAERDARVLWVGIAAAREPLLLWAEQSRAGQTARAASVLALPLRSAFAGAGGVPALIANEACAWQIATSAGRAALASVRPTAGSCSAGSVAVDLLAPDGKSEKTVTLAGPAELDLDMVATSAGFVLAFSQRASLEARAVTALVDSAGNVTAPVAPIIPAPGEQSVLGLVAGEGAESAFLISENLLAQPDGARFLELTALDATARASGASARLLYGGSDGSVAEFTSYAGGVAALTLAPICSADEECDTGLTVPTFVALNARLEVVASEPLLLSALGGRAADLAWGLTCRERCFALAAPSTTPAALFTVPLLLRASRYHAAAERHPEQQRPRLISSEIVAQAAEPLAHLGVASQGGRNLLGYVTDFDPTTPWQKLKKPAPDGRLEPLRASIKLRYYEEAPGLEQTLSLRAHSLGGLSLAPALEPSSKELLAAWFGVDNAQPQLFVTLLGEGGKRLQQRMLTRKSGDGSDAAALALDTGYLVAWVDERSGDPELYAVRLGRRLESLSPEQRLTHADGAASDVQLALLGGKPFVVWADAREGQEPGWADLYGAFVRPHDGARAGEELRLTSTRPHSFSPRLAQRGDALVLAWLERAAEDSASVRIAALSSAGELSSQVGVVPIESGVPRSLGLDCDAQACRVVVTVDAHGRGELLGFEWRRERDPSLVRLTSLRSAGGAEVAPVLRGQYVFAADVSEGQGIVRRLGVAW
jgi:hypothetical protein